MDEYHVIPIISNIPTFEIPDEKFAMVGPALTKGAEPFAPKGILSHVFEEDLSNFCNTVSNGLDKVAESSRYDLDSLEITAAFSAEGKIGIATIISGGLSTSSTIKLTFTKKKSNGAK